MAQSRVTDFFQARKRRAETDCPPSKRQKLRSNEASPAELKKNLAKCTTLSELKCVLKKNAQSPASMPNSVEKNSSPRLTIPKSLTLPTKYEHLGNMFRCTETVLSIMYNRMETCTFDKLKVAVQDMIKKNFEPHHLGQIKTVYPESYDIRLEKDIYINGVKSSKLHLTVEVNLSESVKTGSNRQSRDTRKDGRVKCGTAEISQRKALFRYKLLDFVKKHHKGFIETMSTPVKTDHDKLKHWHSDFRLEDVPDVEPARLPQTPSLNRTPSAMEVLEANRSPYRALLEKTPVKFRDPVDQTPRSKSTLTSARSDKFHRGIPVSLLDRIRAKESAKAAADMSRDVQAEEELDILQRLPDFIRIIRSHFIIAKKAALLEDEIIKIMCDSYKSSISLSRAKQHLDVLVKYMPEWITAVKITSGTFIKIDRARNLSILDNKIADLVKEREL